MAREAIPRPARSALLPRFRRPDNFQLGLGVLLGPPFFGFLREATGSYHAPWLALAVLSVGAAAALHSIPPLVKRE